jgi:hypothetical protein
LTVDGQRRQVVAVSNRDADRQSAGEGAGDGSEPVRVAGLLRFLTDYGLTVVEVDRPDRSARRRNGKSDPLDAESATRAMHPAVPVARRKAATPRSR